MKIALVSMPWMSPYRPSIQLGALAAHLAREAPGVQVDCLHEHLRVARWVGYDLTKVVADGKVSSWLGDALAAYLLFPERTRIIHRFLRFLLEGSNLDLERDLLEPFGRYMDEGFGAIPWHRYDLVGFSSSLVQTTTSLLGARLISRVAPGTRIVFGGPAVCDAMGKSLLDAFPEVDFVVNGEGEGPLAALVAALAEGREPREIPGLVTRRTPTQRVHLKDEAPDLSALPFVDYDSYFELARELPFRSELEQDLELPIEGSRGCWWDRRTSHPGQSCQFCNLNLQWSGYREKPVEHQLREMEHMISRYGVRAFLFVDNVVRRRHRDVVRLFEGIRDRFGGRVRIYMEARANLGPAMWELLASAGVTHCQVGIESLTTSVLRKIRKGTTAIMNLDTMKHMERCGIEDPANIIYDLPGTTPEEVLETVRVVDLARAYYPLGPVRFFLNYGSPYYERFFLQGEAPEGAQDRNYLAWRVMFPPALESTMVFSQRDYEPRIPGMDEANQALLDACRGWSDHYFSMKSRGVAVLLEAIPQADGALIIEDRRHPEPVTHRLTPRQARIYRAFDSRARVDLVAREVGLPEAEVWRVLRELERDGLVFTEGPQALALAISSHTREPRE